LISQNLSFYYYTLSSCRLVKMSRIFSIKTCIIHDRVHALFETEWANGVNAREFHASSLLEIIL